MYIVRYLNNDNSITYINRENKFSKEQTDAKLFSTDTASCNAFLNMVNTEYVIQNFTVIRLNEEAIPSSIIKDTHTKSVMDSLPSKFSKYHIDLLIDEIKNSDTMI